TITMTCDSLLVRHGKRYVLNRPLSVAYATALMLSAKIYYDWYNLDLSVLRSITTKDEFRI
ncbi:MAG: hypothetical protein WAV28_00970, partial [Sedimentisphaerales bacterium]